MNIFQNALKENGLIRFFLLVNILFIIYLLFIGNYNGLTNDDWVFTNAISDLGIFGFVKEAYLSWQGRFAYYFIFSIFLEVYSITFSSIPIVLFLIIFGVGSIFVFLNRLFYKSSRLFVLTLSIFIFNLSVLSALDFTSFFWLTASAYYVIFYSTILLVAILNTKLGSESKILIFILSLIIGGGAESYTLFVILFLSIYIVYLSVNKLQISSGLRISYITILISFIIMVAAPGNQIRMESFSQSNTLREIIFNSNKPFFQLLVFISPKFLFFVLSFFPFAYLGSKSRREGRFRFVRWNYFFLSFIALLLFYYISLLPGIYATSMLTPLRALNYLTFVSIGFFSIWGYFVGLKYKKVNKNLVFVILSLVMGTQTIFLFSVDIPRLRKYNLSHKARIGHLIDLNNDKSVSSNSIVIVDRLVVEKYRNFSSEIYYLFDYLYNDKIVNDFHFFPILVDEITSNPNDFRNSGLKDNLNLKFDVVINDSK